MKLVTVFIILHLFESFTYIFADMDSELRKSMEIVMRCQYRDPPKGPVIAVTPSRFAQIVVILHERFQTPTCMRPSKFTIDVTDERTWPFCVFGKCVQGKCQCAGHFSGPKCSVYVKKCWLMYCYLTSCHPSHQSLHCVCDPKLYGTKTTSGIYWYNEGKSSKYVPPPPGWKDDPTNAIQWGSEEFQKLKSNQKQHDSIGLSAKNGVQGSNEPNFYGELKNDGLSGGIRNGELSGGRKSDELSGGIGSDELSGSQTLKKNRPSYPKAVPGFDSAGRVSGFKPKNRENESNVKDKKADKTDVEEALEELEEVSAAPVLNICSVYLLTFIFLGINFQHEAAA